MKILITGSSGQIGTNSRCACFAAATRSSASTSDRTPGPTSSPTSPGPRGPRAVPRRDQRRRVPGDRPGRPPRRPREGPPARRGASSRARERGDDVQRPRVRASGEHPARLLVEPRGVRRRAPVRGLQRAGRRLRLHREHVLPHRRSQARRSSTRTRGATGSYVFRFSNVYGRYDNDLHRMVRVIPLFIHSMLRGEPITIYGGRDKTLDFTYVDDCVDGIARGIEALAERRVVNQTINLAYGEEHARPLRRADRARARDRAGHDAGAVPARRGHPLRRRPLEGARSSATTRRCRSTTASHVRSPGSGSTARRIGGGTFVSADHERAQERGQGWKTDARRLSRGPLGRPSGVRARRATVAEQLLDLPRLERVREERAHDRGAPPGAGARSSGGGSRCPRRSRRGAARRRGRRSPARAALTSSRRRSG